MNAIGMLAQTGTFTSLANAGMTHLFPSTKKIYLESQQNTFDRLPMTMAKCATCGAKIGGKSHMMLKSNEQ